MTQCQLLTASLKLLPCQKILKEMNGLSRTEKPLITMPVLCHSLSPSSLPFSFPSAHLSFFPFYLFHLSAPLSIYFLWCILSLCTCSVLPPLLFERWTVFLLFFIILTSPAHTQTRILRIPLSFWLSSSAILAVSSCFSLSVSERSVNQRLAGFLTCDYLWSCCGYHFHTAVKCAEYSTQPRREYLITD